MKAKYLSQSTAYALAADHQQLIGQPFDALHSIKYIVAGPYSRILQWAYVAALLRGTAPVLQQYNRFDALVIAMAPDTPAGFLIDDLRSFLETAGIQCDMKRYRFASPFVWAY